MSEPQRSKRWRLEPEDVDASPQTGFGSLQLILWTLWTCFVVGSGYHYVHVAQRTAAQVDVTGLVVYCLIAGIIGLLAITFIEHWLEPWRFLDERD